MVRNLGATPVCCSQSPCWFPGCSFPWLNGANPTGEVCQERRAGRIWGPWHAGGFGMDPGPARWGLLPAAFRPGASRASREGGNGGVKGHGTAGCFSQKWEWFSSRQPQGWRVSAASWRCAQGKIGECGSCWALGTASMAFSQLAQCLWIGIGAGEKGIISHRLCRLWGLAPVRAQSRTWPRPPQLLLCLSCRSKDVQGLPFPKKPSQFYLWFVPGGLRGWAEPLESSGGAGGAHSRGISAWR